MERTHQVSKSPDGYEEILKLKYEYNGIMCDQVNNLLLKLKQKHFEFRDEPGKLLARQLKGAQGFESHS